MKKLILISMGLVFFSFTSFSQAQNETDQSISGTEKSESEREFLLNYFQQTKEGLEEQVAELSEEQMKYKPSEVEWSVSQTLEHIIMTEEMLFGMLQEQMLQPANPERRPEIKFSDDDLLKAITDRSRKATANSELEGKNEFTNPEQALEELSQQRKKVLDFIHNTPTNEMRNRINDSPMGPVDAYQFFLFIAGHTARHTLQIEETIASENFPGE